MMWLGRKLSAGILGQAYRTCADHRQLLFLVAKLRGPCLPGTAMQRVTCNASPSFPLLPSLPLPEGPKGNKALKSIHKNAFNCHWIPCGSPWMDKDWGGSEGRKSNTCEKLNTAHRALNRSIGWAQHRLSMQGRGPTNQTNLCYPPSSESLLSGDSATALH